MLIVLFFDQYKFIKKKYKPILTKLTNNSFGFASLVVYKQIHKRITGAQTIWIHFQRFHLLTSIHCRAYSPFRNAAVANINTSKYFRLISHVILIELEVVV